MTPFLAAVTVMLAGDVMLGRGIDQILRHSVDPVIYEDYMRSAKGYVELAERKSGPIPRRVAPEYVWGDALRTLDAAKPDARIVNLETAVTTASTPWPNKGINYRMHPANVDVLTAARIDCAVLSNNHVLDWGRDGLRETLNALHAAHVQTAGAGASAGEAMAPATINTRDGRLLVLAMGDRSAGIPDAWAPYVNLLPSLDAATAVQLARLATAVAKPGDHTIVSIHWGGNWGYEVSRDQELFAHTLIDNGIDVVHGHSSHHPKGIEIYRGHLIIYGAGDLINDYEGIGGYEEFRPNLSLLYLLRLKGNGELDSMTLLPFRIERFRLNRATAEETRWLRDRLEQYSRGTTFEIRAGSIEATTPSRTRHRERARLLHFRSTTQSSGGASRDRSRAR